MTGIRMALSMASLLQHKSAPIRRLKRLIFGPGTDKRAAARSSAENNEATDRGVNSDFIKLISPI
jgi:hypothetical protein